ncbi:hypothetical protein A2Y83_02785 [Candidatus Falkowbacteria bacterium RBG_13_39_14]|uniref:Uncharacterized protein n=1 Tax=Candidatus Falkowbacteria bacterium RBG_13_39_14 TaxID=1797985 RepID=A0A1F5S148_9BACT|nr:MAG: hypothetical protein A2Y83_02785 [Candidatus Falkowbacteria bacterium RBG_13_39_14]
MTNDKPWYKKWWVIILCIFFGIIVIANLGDNSNDSKTISTKQIALEQKEEVVAVFDLEALHGKSVDEIKDILGTPSSDTEPRDLQVNIKSEDQSAKEWDKTYKKDGYELLVSYDVASRKVIDFFVSTDDPSGVTKDTKKLEKILNVENSNNFMIEQVKALKDPSVYTGIKVVPKN